MGLDISNDADCNGMGRLGKHNSQAAKKTRNCTANGWILGQSRDGPQGCQAGFLWGFLKFAPCDALWRGSGLPKRKSSEPNCRRTSRCEEICTNRAWDQSGPQAAPLASANPSAPSPLNEMDQLVSAARLLEILWDQATRPSVRWLRTQQKRRAIPYIQIGRRIWKTLAGEWNPPGAGDDFPARQI